MGRVKSESITVRLSVWEKSILQENAAKVGMSVTQFITYNLIYKMQNDKKNDGEFNF